MVEFNRHQILDALMSGRCLINKIETYNQSNSMGITSRTKPKFKSEYTIDGVRETKEAANNWATDTQLDRESLRSAGMEKMTNLRQGCGISEIM